MQDSGKLWGGRFKKTVDREFHDLNASIDVDKRLYAEDIQGSIAYAKAIHKANLLSQEELRTIIEGLEKVKTEWEKGQFIIHVQDEDIHTANERRLSELIGNVAKKLHTGRSRNDQTITDTKLWLRKSIDELLEKMTGFVQILINRAKKDINILMPGYTHLQRAQPVKWSQWLLSYAWYAKVDIERLEDIRGRSNVLPLGSGAIAGNPFQIDRHSLASNLNFSKITQNSMYAVGDRDFVAEFLFWSTLTAIHLSRFAEDLIIYSSEEFGFVRLADEYSTGSSLMPQKRNPDCMELIRGKSGTLLGKIPFREAHHLAGNVVVLAESLGVSIFELTLEQLQTVSRIFEDDVMKIWNFTNSVEQYRVDGGTSTAALKEQINNLQSWLQQSNRV
ncbi:argininosuccinate lyase isoform X3 [Nomia melanderi]|uniref:argininosuccinate lyase isoform X3 n=1 Tax=Nomia melanderi TaxID=2448451 RepID=UPI003FCE16AD